jgi:hypothetical protein
MIYRFVMVRTPGAVRPAMASTSRMLASSFSFSKGRHWDARRSVDGATI